MLKEPISITALSSISALGSDEKSITKAYQNPSHFLTLREIGDCRVWVGELSGEDKQVLKELQRSDSKYRNLDATVLNALYVSKKAIAQAGWGKEDRFGINIGSSRGATKLFEKYHKDFIENGKAHTLTSPTTTLGNISSWVAHDLKSKGPVISHSITCSTALHSILNAVAWIQSGLSDKFLVGGSEAPLTPFTIAQMQALKIYSKLDGSYPCRSYDMAKNKNTMVLGEGAATACLEKGISEQALAKIEGIGYATEILTHNVSISNDAKCFQDAMKMALGHHAPGDIDAIVMHAPGTVKGDLSELNAIKAVFRDKEPFLTTNKWKVGHTFGASGMLSLELALLMLKHQLAVPVPFVKYEQRPKTMNKVLVNAVGFGGNAVSILLSR